MKQITINTISDQVVLFLHQNAYSEKDLSKELNISPQTISNRIKMNNFRFDETRAIKSLFNRYNLKLIV
jgi:predicted transcriptional regulator